MAAMLTDLSSGKIPGSENVTLLVSPDHEDFRAMTSILEQDLWKVRGVQSFREAIQVLQDEEHPAVIACERMLPDGDWKDLFDFLAVNLPNPPPFVVFSNQADEPLWAEVLNLGGYDVLAKPFETTEVQRVMSMARRHSVKHRVMVH